MIEPIRTPASQRLDDFRRRLLPVLIWSACAVVCAVLIFERDGPGNLVFHVLDARVEHGLLFLGRVVLRILLEVTVFARLGNRLRNARALDLLQPVQLFPQCGLP